MIDKKYPLEDVADNYHELKNTESNDYFAVTSRSDAEKSKLDEKKKSDEME